MLRLKEKYQNEVIPAMTEMFGYKNKMAVPKLEKVAVNVGIGPELKDPKILSTIFDTVKRITGQCPIERKAKKSIAGFKIRKGLTVGVSVTLRRGRMYDFLDRLINIVLPRVRDFRGLSPKSLDERGNLAIGFRENVAFPEIQSAEISKIHGLEVAIATTAKNKEEGLELLKLLGFPFRPSL